MADPESSESKYDIPEEWQVEAGPRNKTLATYHLELIAHALLDPRSKVIFSTNNADDVIVSVNDFPFNLTKIIDASPDFVHLHFNEIQLNRYVELRNFNEFISASPDPTLHYAEYLAIRSWTGRSYSDLNALLRSPTFSRYNIDSLQFNLLTICIASQGLSKPNSSTHKVTTCTRKERHCPALSQRAISAKDKKPVTNRGFTASSRSTRKWRGDVVITIYQADSINPAGKSIEHISSYRGEQEVLFPPNTDFLYWREEEKVNKWTAIPVVPANSPSTRNYTHTFSEDQLDQITLMHFRIRMNMIQDFLKTKFALYTIMLSRIFSRVPNDSSGLYSFEELNQLIDALSAEVGSRHLNAVPGLQYALSCAEALRDDWRPHAIKSSIKSDHLFSVVEEKNDNVFEPRPLENSNVLDGSPNQALALQNAKQHIDATYDWLNENIVAYFNRLNKEYQNGSAWSSSWNNKLTRANELAQCFQNPTGSLQQRATDLRNFYAVLKQPQTSEILGEHRTKKWLLIMANVLTSLTVVGLLAQICQGRFTLWKSKGAEMVSRANKIMKSLDERFPLSPPSP